MRRLLHRRLAFTVGAALAAPVGCSRLTEVDWELIPSADVGGSSTGGAPSAADAGAGGQAGQAPDGGTANEGGQGGEAGAGAPATGGTGGAMGGSGEGGLGGMAGSGGSAGAAVSGAGSGGTAGAAGQGGSGGGGPAPCTGTPSPVGPSDLVLFDGGTGERDTARGGRPALDAACEVARVTLRLAQTKTHAFITVSSSDAIGFFETVFPDMPAERRVVSKSGIQLASSFRDLVDGSIEQSMVCAGVVPPQVKTWLTGCKYGCSLEAGSQVCGQFESLNDTCDGWTLGTYHPQIQARRGSTTSADQSFFSTAVPHLPHLKVSCDTAVDNVFCLAYTPE